MKSLHIDLARPSDEDVQRYVDIIQNATGFNLNPGQAVALIHACILCAAHLDEELGGDGHGPSASFLLVSLGIDDAIELMKTMAASREATAPKGSPS